MAFSISDSQMRLSAIEGRAKEIKSEISKNKAKTKAGEVWSNYLVKTVNTFILSTLNRRDDLGAVDAKVITMMMSKAEQYPHRGLAQVPLKRIPASKKFLSQYNRFNNLFIAGLRRQSKFEATINAGIDTSAWVKASDMLLNGIQQQFNHQKVKQIIPKLLMRSGSSPNSFVQYYKLDEDDATSLLLTVSASQAAYLQYTSNITVKGLITTQPPPEREVEYWKKQNAAKQLVKRRSPNRIHERRKRNIISTFIGSALGLETLEEGEANLHKIEDLEQAAESSFDQVNRGINRLKNITLNNTLTLMAEEELMEDVKASLDRITYVLPEIQILTVIQGKVRRVIKQYENELKACEKDMQCTVYFNTTSVVLSRPKAAPTKMIIEMASIYTMPFLVDKKAFHFDLPKHIFFTEEGNIIPEDNCEVSSRTSCRCTFDDMYQLPNVCERALVEFIQRRSPIDDSSCAGHLKKYHDKAEKMVRTSRNTILIFTTQPTDCTHKCTNPKMDETKRMMGLAKVMLKPLCQFCCETWCAEFQGRDQETVTTLRFRVREAIQEMKEYSVDNMTFHEVMQHIEKTELYQKSWREIASELKRRKALDFGERFKEWTTSHRLASPILISTLVMSTIIIGLVGYCCWGPITKLYKIIKCCKSCLPTPNRQNNRQPSGASADESIFTAGSTRDNSRINLIRTRPNNRTTEMSDASTEMIQLQQQDTGSTLASSISTRPARPPPYNMNLNVPPLAEGV